MKKVYHPSPHSILMNIKQLVKSAHRRIHLENPICYKKDERLDGGAYHYKCYEDCKLTEIVWWENCARAVFDRNAIGAVHSIKYHLTFDIPISNLNAKQRKALMTAAVYSLAKQRAVVENRHEAELAELIVYLQTASAEDIHLLRMLIK